MPPLPSFPSLSRILPLTPTSSPAVQIKVLHFSAGIAWHPSPSQTPGTVQLVTGSADKTARLFSGEGKQLGSLQVTSPLQLVVNA